MITNLWEHNFLIARGLSILAGASRGVLPFCPLGKWAGVIASGTAGIIPRLIRAGTKECRLPVNLFVNR